MSADGGAREAPGHVSGAPVLVAVTFAHDDPTHAAHAADLIAGLRDRGVDVDGGNPVSNAFARADPVRRLVESNDVVLLIASHSYVRVSALHSDSASARVWPPLLRESDLSRFPAVADKLVVVTFPDGAVPRWAWICASARCALSKPPRAAELDGLVDTIHSLVPRRARTDPPATTETPAGTGQTAQTASASSKGEVHGGASRRPAAERPAEKRRPRVFISYSHDSPRHRADVLAFGETLESRGARVRLDQFREDRPPHSWLAWMERQIDKADFVLIICTETYRRRVEDREKEGVGLGARWEGALISDRVYRQARLHRSSPFIPVIFRRADVAHVPHFVAQTTYYLVSDDAESDLEALVLRIFARRRRRERPPDKEAAAVAESAETAAENAREARSATAAELHALVKELEVSPVTSPKVRHLLRRVAEAFARTLAQFGTAEWLVEIFRIVPSPASASADALLVQPLVTTLNAPPGKTVALRNQRLLQEVYANRQIGEAIGEAQELRGALDKHRWPDGRAVVWPIPAQAGTADRGGPPVGFLVASLRVADRPLPKDGAEAGFELAAGLSHALRAARRSGDR
jgi:hypothetical protein